MSLLVLWKNNPEQIRRYSLRQIVAMAGDGRVLDGSTCSEEIRRFLTHMEADVLEEFANECLEESFGDSGFVLQDLVNEIGRRLEFEVEPGLYRGRKGKTGFDGVWRGGEGLEFVIEAKTTDVFNIDIDQVEKYRRELISSDLLTEQSSVLFVVGRKDSGALETQIRGSRHAWRMRVIGIASLIKLLKIKVKSESNSAVSRIKLLLRPVEYIRLDGIVDLMADAATEAGSEAGTEQPELANGMTEIPSPQRAASGVASAGIDGFRGGAAKILSRKFGVQLVRQRRSSFVAADGSIHAIVAVSKRYERDYQSYWYGFYDTQKRFLEEAPAGYLVLGALDTGRIYVLPLTFLEPLLPRIKFTLREEGQMYWHIITKLMGEECRLVVQGEEVSLSAFETNLSDLAK